MFRIPGGSVTDSEKINPGGCGASFGETVGCFVAGEVTCYQSRAGTHRSRATSYDGGGQRPFSAFHEGVVQGRDGGLQKRVGEGL